MNFEEVCNIPLGKILLCKCSSAHRVVSHAVKVANTYKFRPEPAVPGTRPQLLKAGKTWLKRREFGRKRTKADLRKPRTTKPPIGPYIRGPLCNNITLCRNSCQQTETKRKHHNRLTSKATWNRDSRSLMQRGGCAGSLPSERFMHPQSASPPGKLSSVGDCMSSQAQGQARQHLRCSSDSCSSRKRSTNILLVEAACT